MNKPKATLQEIADRHGVYTFQEEDGGSIGTDKEPKWSPRHGWTVGGNWVDLSLLYDIEEVRDYSTSLHCPTPEIKQPPEGYNCCS